MGRNFVADIAKLVSAKKMCFNWDPKITHISNVVETTDWRLDVHRDLSHDGYAIAHVQANKNAKSPVAKAFLKKVNKSGSGSHKTTHKNFTTIRFSQTNFNLASFQTALENAKEGEYIDLAEGEIAGASGSGSMDNYGSSVATGQGDYHGAGQNPDYSGSSTAVQDGTVVWEYDEET